MSTLTGMDRAHVTLIESRLDSIERNLMDSRVGRSERQDLVQAVEREVYELLEAHQGKVSRDVVLRVLGSIAPPEAYRFEEPREMPVRAAQFARPAKPVPAIIPGSHPVPRSHPVPHSHPVPGNHPTVPQFQHSAPPQCTSPHCVQRKTSSLAFAAMVLALLSIPAVIVIPIGTILALAGAICGGVAWYQISRSGGLLGGKGMAIFSLVIFAIHLCLICVVLASL